MTARHFKREGTISQSDLVKDIKADIKSARGAQRDLERAGSHKTAEDLGRAADEFLDELSDAMRGTWHPQHGR